VQKIRTKQALDLAIYENPDMRAAKPRGLVKSGRFDPKFGHFHPDKKMHFRPRVYKASSLIDGGPPRTHQILTVEMDLGFRSSPKTIRDAVHRITINQIIYNESDVRSVVSVS